MDEESTLIGKVHHVSGDEYAVVVGQGGMIAFAYGPLGKGFEDATPEVLYTIIDNQVTDGMEETATWLESELDASRAEFLWTKDVQL